MVFEITEHLDIKQRCSTEYSNMDLFVGENVYMKQYFYQGILTIDGNCDIIQISQMIIDH